MNNNLTEYLFLLCFTTETTIPNDGVQWLTFNCSTKAKKKNYFVFDTK